MESDPCGQSGQDKCADGFPDQDDLGLFFDFMESDPSGQSGQDKCADDLPDKDEFDSELQGSRPQDDRVDSHGEPKRKP